MFELINQNKDWFLSGLGIAIAGFLFRYFRQSKNNANTIEQSVGKNVKGEKVKFKDIRQTIGNKPENNND